MYFLGIEHGTRAIRCLLIESDSSVSSFPDDPAVFFEIKRDVKKFRDDRYPSLIEILGQHVEPRDITLGAMTYSMGDGFTRITDIRKLQNRGIRSIKGAGTITGLGSAIFDEMVQSTIPLFGLPGIHRDTPTLLPTFRQLYSHCSAPDKVASAYLASLFIQDHGMNGRNFILSDIGANTVTLIIKDGEIIGGIDAALGAPGLIQSPIDLSGIRRIDQEHEPANEVYSTSGLYPGHRDESTYTEDPQFREKLDALVDAVAMEVSGLSIFLEAPEMLILTGSAPSLDEEGFIERFRGYLPGTPIRYLGERTGSLGCACIARDIHHGRREFLGISVNDDAHE